MKPARYDLALYRGDTYQWRYRLWQDAEQTIPVDLAGVGVAAEIRDRPGGSKITEMPCVVTLPNIIDVMLSAIACGMLPTKGSWDLQLTYPNDPDPIVRTIVAGAVQVTADVTESTRTPVPVPT